MTPEMLPECDFCERTPEDLYKEQISLIVSGTTDSTICGACIRDCNSLFATRSRGADFKTKLELKGGSDHGPV